MNDTPSERDRIADQRDRLADERDRKADEREREADARDRNAARTTPSKGDTNPLGVDDDLFGINLGPAREGTEADDSDQDSMPASVRPPTRTLTERLASAAADRDDTEAPNTGEGSPTD